MRWLVINQKKNIVFDPKCINHNQSLGHSAMGYILPCCFMDAFASKEIGREEITLEMVGINM